MRDEGDEIPRGLLIKALGGGRSDRFFRVRKRQEIAGIRRMRAGEAEMVGDEKGAHPTAKPFKIFQIDGARALTPPIERDTP